MSLFNEIKAACRNVAEGANFVHIDRVTLREYARALSSAGITSPTLDRDSHFLGHGEQTLAFILILDSINFGSGWFPQLRKRTGKSGYFTVASSLRDAFSSGWDFSPARLAQLSASDCVRLFGQDYENAPIRELMGKFANAMNDLGRLVLDQYHGSYGELIESADQSAEKLVRVLSAMPFFQDVEVWRGLRVPFYKRAQLTAADLAAAFDCRGWGTFHDLNEMTIFADNLVPHVLRVDRVLLYDRDLAARIDREELIPAGSVEEIEIRACGLHAVELMVEEVERLGRTASAVALDYLLWNRGQSNYYKSVKPRHRTRTVFY